MRESPNRVSSYSRLTEVMPRWASAATVALAKVFRPARPLVWFASESPADSSMSPLPLRVNVLVPSSDWVRNTWVSKVDAMFRVDEAASAVSVFSVDAGSRGVFDSCSAATVPWASSMITDVSFPTPCADSNSLTSAEAAVESMALFAFKVPATVPPDLAVAGSAKTGAATGFNVNNPGATSVMSAGQYPANRAMVVSAEMMTVSVRRCDRWVRRCASRR